MKERMEHIINNKVEELKLAVQSANNDIDVLNQISKEYKELVKLANKYNINI